MSKIEWTDKTLCVVRGCSLTSAGCQNCYAMKMAHRFSWGAGLTEMSKHGPRWNGSIRLVPEKLADPFRWRKSQRIFVCSTSDLFHPSVPFEFIAAVFGVAAACPQHDFQLLTKRPERMREFFVWLKEWYSSVALDEAQFCALMAIKNGVDPKHIGLVAGDQVTRERVDWPLPNVHLGTSVENQQEADKRIPELFACPAAVRFLSCEPLLGPVDIEDKFWGDWWCPTCDSYLSGSRVTPEEQCDTCGTEVSVERLLHWVIAGGESGPQSRPFDVSWGRSIIEQCKGAETPVFMKQVGARPRIIAGPQEAEWDSNTTRFQEHVADGEPMEIRLKHSKGADPSEWPRDLRVQEFPRTGRTD